MKVYAADLFAGAGGASTGLQLAATASGVDLNLVAVNHWPAAVKTHALNHPEARHLCETMERVDPRDAVPGGHLHLLIAGPECTFFSTARGGRPIDDQRRSSAWTILRWLELLRVDHVLIENVPEFQAWAPLGPDDRPLKSHRGEVFRAYLAAIEALNYRVEYRVLNAADYGEATTRKRLFIQAARGGRIAWPEPTHSRRGEGTPLRHTRPWRPAREVIDWSLPSESIFTRKRPLSQNTLRRIEAGLRRFGGAPFVLGQQSGSVPRQTKEPLPTVAASGAISLVEPFLSSYCGHGSNVSVSQPVPTVTALALIIPDGIDIHYRMLQPHELAAAMGFPPGYRFIGTKSDTIRMIGNAWSVRVATALCSTILERWAPARPVLNEEIA